jgi:hypothetical protein
MTQVARRASLVALLLLASVGTASAECAWALWREEEENVRGFYRKEWATPVAYNDRAACVVVIAERVRNWEQGERSPLQEVRPASNGTAAEFVTWTTGRAGYIISRLHCLPDTIDPRGPKTR